MPRTSKQFLKAAAAARAAKAHKSANQTQKESEKGPTTEVLDSDSDGNLDHMNVEDRCGWDGDVNCQASDESADGGYSESDKVELQELEGVELLQSLELCLTREHKLLRKFSLKEWGQAEKKRGLGYNGLSARTKQRHNQKAREKELKDAVMCQR